MKRCPLLILAICILPLSSTISQDVWEIDDDTLPQSGGSSSKKIAYSLTVPVDWLDWMPAPNQFQLYVNIVDGSDSASPKLSILDNNNFSCQFRLSFAFDTLYIDIIPPGFIHDKVSIDSLPFEVPIVIRAGTERAIYWFSNDNGVVNIDTTLLPASFISLKAVKPLPDDLVYLYLPGSGKYAKRIHMAVNEVHDKQLATLIQLDDGFYQGIWGHVSKITIQRFKINQVGKKTANVGALLVFKLSNLNNHRAVQSILDKISDL